MALLLYLWFNPFFWKNLPLLLKDRGQITFPFTYVHRCSVTHQIFIDQTWFLPSWVFSLVGETDK